MKIIFHILMDVLVLSNTGQESSLSVFISL